MRWINRRISVLLFLCLLTGSLWSCKGKELTKTIILPEERQAQLDGIGINIRNIQEYSYERTAMDQGNLTMDQKGNLCLLLRRDNGCEYQKIDLNSKEVIQSLVIEEPSMSNLQLAPGGRYISYEVMEKKSIRRMLYSVEEQTKQILYQWDDVSEQYLYKWSGDGTKLFVWDDGINYGQDAYDRWYIYQYTMKGVEKEQEYTEETGMMEEKYKMPGNGYSWRWVLPSQDGSRIFVREEFIDGDGNRESNATTDREYSVNGEEKRLERNCLIEPERGNHIWLQNLPEDLDYVIKYTREGLFAKDMNGTLVLVTELLEQPVKRELLITEDEGNGICEAGDHIFRIERDSNTDRLQLVGIQVKNKELSEQQTLYKDLEGDAVEIVCSWDDQKLMVQSSKYVGDDRYLCKVIVLEY